MLPERKIIRGKAKNIELSVSEYLMEIPARPTPIPHSFLRLNQCGGRGSRLVDFSLSSEKKKNS